MITALTGGRRKKVEEALHAKRERRILEATAVIQQRTDYDFSRAKSLATAIVDQIA